MAGRFNFPAIIRGDTKTLALFLRGKGPISLQKVVFPLAGALVEWRLVPAGRDPILRTNASGLLVDVATGFIALPLSSADTTGMPAMSVPYRLRITDSDGVATTHLVGVIPFED